MGDPAPLAREEVARRMADYVWYHTLDLGHGLITPGQYDHRPLLPCYGIPDNLVGKSVLDVGPAHGFFAFEFERRGAARVVAVELPRWSAHDASPALKNQFRREKLDERIEGYLHGALEFAIQARGSRVERLLQNVYDLNPETTGEFDLVFCASVLIHLSDPVRALYAIRSVTRDHALIATAISRDWLGRRPRAVFRGSAAEQVFWAPSMRCLERWSLAAGFRRVERLSRFRVVSRDGKFNELHGAIRAYV